MDVAKVKILALARRTLSFVSAFGFVKVEDAYVFLGACKHCVFFKAKLLTLSSRLEVKKKKRIPSLC